MTIIGVWYLKNKKYGKTKTFNYNSDYSNFNYCCLALGLKRRGGQQAATLEIWSAYDDQGVYTELIEAYQNVNKRITINFQKKSPDTYEQELVNALASGKGPDIFIIHNTWLPKHKTKISPMPQLEGFINAQDFQNMFVDVAYQDFVSENKIYAIPLYIDTLALYYNKDFLNSAGISFPPANWDEFMDDVEKLTKKDQWGNIERSGVAMGTAQNINRSTDILALLMLQTGTEMVSQDYRNAVFNQATHLKGESFNPGRDALRFYTDFSNPTKRVYCWNRSMPYSIDAFYQGKAAMMINYSYNIDTIRAKSPYLNFGIAPVPQIKNRDFDINYPNYWALTVSRNSKYPEAAWQFILYLSQKENLKKYSETAKRPVSRRDLIEWQRENPDLGVFANQALSAKSWYQIDSQAIETIFADMVESVVLGAETINQALDKAADQITILMKK